MQKDYKIIAFLLTDLYNTISKITMNINEFNYILDKKLIAQHPAKGRAASKMMVLYKSNSKIIHSHFYEFPDFISDNYVIVMNDSKVFPARLYAKDQNNNQIELLLTKEIKDGIWEVMARPMKKLKLTSILYFGDNVHYANIKSFDILKRPIIEFFPKNNLWDFINNYGKPPLPPYIKRKINEYSPLDQERYQTIYAEKIGSIAAPTAGFHFTQEILDELTKKNIELIKITLHVGPATFSPIRTASIHNHKMEPEYFEISVESFYKIKKAKKKGKQILAIGTTSTRALESIDLNKDIDSPIKTYTDLFIYPSYHFKIVDALLTNLHLPKSTLLLLVCAFTSKQLILSAYNEAITHKYRFYSFGDCMLILP